MIDPQFIVGEVSKNWTGGKEDFATGPLCQQFENVIEVNRVRGYRLHSFQVHRLMVGSCMNETVIAVFERVSADQPENKP